MCKFFAGIDLKMCIITVFTKIKKTTDFKTNFLSYSGGNIFLGHVTTREPHGDLICAKKINKLYMCNFFVSFLLELILKMCLITVFTKIKKTTDFKTNFLSYSAWATFFLVT